MKSFDLVKSFVVAVAAAGVVLPAGAVQASSPVAPAAAQAPVTDIALVSGQLNGRVVDAQGVSLNGAMVVVRQNGEEVARTTSDNNGQFKVAGLKSGVYQVSAGNSEGVYRVWSERTAPPAAKNGVVMVSSAAPVRGQSGIGGGLTPINIAALTIGTAGLAVGIVALNEAGKETTVIVPVTP